MNASKMIRLTTFVFLAIARTETIVTIFPLPIWFRLITYLFTNYRVYSIIPEKIKKTWLFAKSLPHLYSAFILSLKYLPEVS
jgi:hypothetical protein